MKGAKSIAEYAIRRWLQTQGFSMNYFELIMIGNEGVLKDKNGNSMTLIYDGETKTVLLKE